jgi:hypothetical protein
MAIEGEFSSGWKVMVVLAVLFGMTAVGIGAFGKREDPRIAELQDRIQQLEKKLHDQQFMATKGGKAVIDRDYGE